MAKITQVRVVRRVPKEEYGFVEAEIIATVTAKEDVEAVIQELSDNIFSAAILSMEVGGSEDVSAGDVVVEDEETPAPKKSRKSKAKKVEDEDEEEEEEGDDEEDDEDDEEEPAPKKGSKKKASKKAKTEEEDDEDDVPSTKPKKKKGAKRSKKTTYDRENDEHKMILTEVIREEYPNFEKKKKLLARIKKASIKMDGRDFLDSDGNILVDFEDDFLDMLEK